MKKVITITLLVITLLAGGMTIDAKTTKKKPKARTTQVTNTFTDFEKQFILPSELVEKTNGKYWNAENEKILKILKQKGYKLSDEYNWDDYEWTAYKEAYNPNTGNLYSMEITRACGAHICEIIIEFANVRDAQEFYNKIKKYNNKTTGWSLHENTVSYSWM